MKLSKAQQSVMDEAKKDIDFARTHSIMEWAMEKRRVSYTCTIVTNYELYGFKTKEEAIKDVERTAESYAREYAEYYEEEKNGIVLTHCSSKTLLKLEKLGLIEIIFDSNGYSYGIDRIKVLNY